VALAGALGLLSVVLSRVEQRRGVVLADPVLAVLAPRDFTWLTFVLIYAGLALGLVHLAPSPRALVTGVRAYALLVVLRAMTMLLVPLEPPPGMIVLRDPFAEHVVAAPVLTRDLFFSGHTATVFLLFLAARDAATKRFFLACSAAVGVFVLWQHVHYTIDVVAAPVFAYASFAAASRSMRAPIAVEAE
jgi:hypothetical protein